jgi:hypothetical protein
MLPSEPLSFNVFRGTDALTLETKDKTPVHVAFHFDSLSGALASYFDATTRSWVVRALPGQTTKVATIPCGDFWPQAGASRDGRTALLGGGPQSGLLLAESSGGSWSTRQLGSEFEKPTLHLDDSGKALVTYFATGSAGWEPHFWSDGKDQVLPIAIGNKLKQPMSVLPGASGAKALLVRTPQGFRLVADLKQGVLLPGTAPLVTNPCGVPTPCAGTCTETGSGVVGNAVLWDDGTTWVAAWTKTDAHREIQFNPGGGSLCFPQQTADKSKSSLVFTRIDAATQKLIKSVEVPLPVIAYSPRLGAAQRGADATLTFSDAEFRVYAFDLANIAK